MKYNETDTARAYKAIAEKDKEIDDYMTRRGLIKQRNSRQIKKVLGSGEVFCFLCRLTFWGMASYNKHVEMCKYLHQSSRN